MEIVFTINELSWYEIRFDMGTGKATYGESGMIGYNIHI